MARKINAMESPIGHIELRRPPIGRSVDLPLLIAMGPNNPRYASRVPHVLEYTHMHSTRATCTCEKADPYGAVVAKMFLKVDRNSETKRLLGRKLAAKDGLCDIKQKRGVVPLAWLSCILLR